MFILPVLDLLNGVVVRGVAGRRETYRPVESQICSSAEPLAVAKAFRNHFGLERLYVADLDAILRQIPNFDTYRLLADAGFGVSVDAGVGNVRQAEALLEARAEAVISGLESTPSPELLQALVHACGPQRVVFSLDLQAGRPLVGGRFWEGMTPLQIAELVIENGIERLIVLDLAQVGVSGGLSTLELCKEIQKRAPHVELITGGGVRDADDLRVVAESNIHGVLIASALHNGRLTRRDLDTMSQGPIPPR